MIIIINIIFNIIYIQYQYNIDQYYIQYKLYNKVKITKTQNINDHTHTHTHIYITYMCNL